MKVVKMIKTPTHTKVVVNTGEWFFMLLGASMESAKRLLKEYSDGRRTIKFKRLDRKEIQSLKDNK